MTKPHACHRLWVLGLVAAVVGASPASASYAIYQDLPTSLATPPNISWHNTSGPVLADDFAPVRGGRITSLTWWGSDSDSVGFEVVLQTDDPILHQPALTPAGNIMTGGLKQFVTATKTAGPIPGIVRYSAAIAPGWSVGVGKSYWLTVANAQDGWQWATALAGPTIGQEFYNAHRSTGPGCLDGGPHCGPWTDVHTDFAFEIAAVPEPASWALLISGFGLVGAMARRRTIAQVEHA